LNLIHKILNYFPNFKIFLQTFIFFSNQPNQIKVRLGEWNLAGFIKPFPVLDYDVTDIVIHSYFDNNTLAYNLAMLYLAMFVPLGQYPHIGTACLPMEDLAYSGLNCMVN
jgi:hypothetical protein